MNTLEDSNFDFNFIYSNTSDSEYDSDFIPSNSFDNTSDNTLDDSSNDTSSIDSSSDSDSDSRSDTIGIEYRELSKFILTCQEREFGLEEELVLLREGVRSAIKRQKVISKHN